MSIAEKIFDVGIIEAEENLLIDLQFLIQELLNEKGISRSDLAKRTGISKARLSQILSSEANPTVKTFARLAHALGARICVAKNRVETEKLALVADWDWDMDARPISSEKKRSDRMVAALLRQASASNDNYVMLEDVAA